MSLSNQSVQSYYMEFLRCARCSHGFEYENPLYHPITLPICGHTMCRQYQVSIEINHTPIDQLPTNYPLLIILHDPSKLPEDKKERYGQCPSYMKLDDATKAWFSSTETVFGKISLIIKPIINDKECQSIFSRSMIQKIFSLLNSQYIDCVGRLKVLKQHVVLISMSSQFSRQQAGLHGVHSTYASSKPEMNKKRAKTSPLSILPLSNLQQTEHLTQGMPQQYHDQDYYDPSQIASSILAMHHYSTTTTTVTPSTNEHQPTNSNNNNTDS